MKVLQKIPRLLPLFLLLSFMTGCFTVPETGRRGFSVVPVSQEVAMGENAFAQIKKQETISPNREQTEMLQRVGDRIARVAESDMPEAVWEFVLFENDAVNAFALPGGRIGFYTGMLEIADTEEYVAVVMGHEIAHVTARHGAERLSQALAIMAVGIGVQQAVKDRSEEVQLAVLLAYGAGTTLGVALPHSRRNEREADEIGLYYMARAGYDPRAAPRFWERMEAQAGGGSIPEFLSTHPSHGSRVQNLERAMSRALEYYRESGGE